MDTSFRESAIYKRRWLTLAAITVSVIVVVLDATIVNVALPTLQRELGSTGSQLQWIVNAYILAFGALMLPAGLLGDRLGRARVLQAGILLFAVGSAAAVFAKTSEALIAFRAFMGMGAAMILPSTLAIITNVFPREERGRAIGIWAGLNGLGLALGPIIGGILIQHYSWSSIFLVNLPVGVVALLAGWFFIPDSRDPNPQRLDLLGSALSILAVGGLVYGLTQGTRDGWSSLPVAGTLAGALVFGTMFVLWERHTKHPMIDPAFFQSRRFSIGVAAVCLVALSQVGISFGLTQYMQFVRGYTPLQAGIRYIPFALGILIGAGSSDRAVKKLGTTAVMAMGFAGLAAFVILSSFWTVDTEYWRLGLIFFGIAFSLGYIAGPAADAVMGALPESKAGAGSAVNSVSRTIAGSIGVATLGSILNGVYASSFQAGAVSIPGLTTQISSVASDSVGTAMTIAGRLPEPIAEAIRRNAGYSFIDAWQVMTYVSCAIAIVALVVVLVLMPPRHEPARGTIAEEGE